MSVLWPILRQQIAHPTRVCMIDDQRSWRGIDLVVGAMHVAEALESATDARHIGILLPTSGLFPMAAMAAWMLGRTVVPLNYLLKRDDLQFVCDDAGIDTILTVGPMVEFIGGPPAGQRLLRLDQLNFKRVPEVRWPATVYHDDLAVLLYTSGTSGKPKGVMLTHANLSANIRQCAQWVEFGPGDSLVGVLPQFHVFGLTVLTLLPLTIGRPAYFTARFVPRKIIRMLRDHRPTVLVGIASMFNAFLGVKDAAPEDFASLRLVISGGEALPDATAKAFRERFEVTICEGFGMTETSAVTHWCRSEEYRPHSVGRAIPDVEVRIVSADERDLGPNEDGELRVRGPNIMKGYYKRPAETAAAFDSQGFLRTGDMARVDDDGFLFITGRIKEMMIIGGENVFPREIEEVLNRYPSVHASAVIGVKDPSRGEVAVAFVELNEGATFDATAIRSFCREHLAQFKVPRDIFRLDALPRNPTGKILRRELKVPELVPA